MQLPPPVHGASVMNAHVADSELLAAHFDIDVLPLRFANSVDDIGSVSLRKLGRVATHAARLLARTVRRRPDAVYFTLSPVGGSFYRDCLFIALLKLLRVPRVYHLHGKGIGRELDDAWKQRLYAWAFANAWVIHLSPMLATETAPIAEANRVRFIPNGITPTASAPTRTARERPRILYVSNMSEDKGPLVLVDALAELADRGVQFEATFAGAPFGDCVDKFERKVAERRLGANVRYVGPQYGEAKDKLFADHDIFVFPTYYAQEAFPLVLIEAMQHGLPVVTTFEGAIPEMVEDGVTGCLVPQRDHRALAAKIAQLVDDEVLRRRMGNAGRQRYEERFTLDRFEAALSDVLREVVGQG